MAVVAIAVLDAVTEISGKTVADVGRSNSYYRRRTRMFVNVSVFVVESIGDGAKN